jgi:hypothetical protein
MIHVAGTCVHGAMKPEFLGGIPMRVKPGHAIDSLRNAMICDDE